MAATITGTAGNDQLTGTSGNEQIFGLAGDDAIYGGGGQDTVDGGPGSDLITVSAGADVTTGPGQDTVYSFQSITIEDFTPGAGGDVLRFDNGLVLAHSSLAPFSTGGSWVAQEGANAVLYTQTVGPFGGPVQIVFRNVDAGALTADNFIASDPPNPGYVHFDPQAGVIRGGPGADALGGSISQIYVGGGDGADTLFGNPNGGDRLDGGNGADLIVHGAGAATLLGGAGDDTIWAGSGPDTVQAGDGNDVIYAQGGADTLSGGAGADTFVIDPKNTQVVLTDFNLGEGDQVVVASGVSYYEGIGVLGATAYLSNGQTIVFQGAAHVPGLGWLSTSDTAGNDTIFPPSVVTADTQVGGSGADVMVGGPATNNESGGGGADTLWGNTSTDFLFGGAGNDVMVGGGATNLMSGGPGADRFIVSPNDTGDWITDFSAAEGDRLILPSGVTFSLVQYDWGVAVALSNGAAVGLAGLQLGSVGGSIGYG